MHNPQSTESWKLRRRGKITASRFGDVIAKPTTKRYQDYMQQIVDEILGVPDFDDEDKPWFRHGKEWEDQARSLYEWETDYIVTLSDSIAHIEYDFISCSPDGLIGDLYCIEIKCHKSLRAHLNSVEKGLPSEHIPQVQGQLWITRCSWCDFISFYKTEEQNTVLCSAHRVRPDFEYHKILEEKCLDFWEKIQTILKDRK